MNRVCDWDIRYPFLLKQIHNYPKCLYYKGDLELLKGRLVTIVGTRKITSYGKQVVRSMLYNFPSLLSVSFVSGLAIGVDVYVHRLCLENNLRTVAVVAGGLDNGYPKCNGKEYEQISETNLVLAEYPCGTKLIKGMFPIRNRILAGISDTVIVIEGDIDSGSMITADLALEYGRDVYVIPGDIFRKTSRGCNELIKQGAGIIASREDFLNIFNIYSEQMYI
ncbi:MAG: DNA-processing protein DprA [Candidatus Dojkabacteria bacterium]|nr:DNA-processing protein DprA [Candidatus Dojkabacteria bacterium]